MKLLALASLPSLALGVTIDTNVQVNVGADVNLSFLPRTISASTNASVTTYASVPSDSALAIFKSESQTRRSPYARMRATVFARVNGTDGEPRDEERLTYSVKLLRVAEITSESETALTASNKIDLQASGSESQGWSMTSEQTSGNVRTEVMTFTEGDATVTLETAFAAENTTQGSQTFTPNALKWTLKVSDFPYQSSGKLAILVGVTSTGTTTFNRDDRKILIQDGKGTVTWTNSVKVGTGLLASQDSTLVASSLGAETNGEFTAADDVGDVEGEAMQLFQWECQEAGVARFEWDPANEVDEGKAVQTSTPSLASAISSWTAWSVLVVLIAGLW